MRTEKVKLSGTHFFLRTEKCHFFYTHGLRLNSLATRKSPHIFAVSKGNKQASVHSFNSYRMTKLK